MSVLKELCKDAICGIKDEEGIYTEEKLLNALEQYYKR